LIEEKCKREAMNDGVKRWVHWFNMHCRS